MKNEKSAFLSRQTEIRQTFLDRRGSGRSAFGGGYIYGGECGLPKESFRSENRRRKSWIKGISALYGSCKI